MAMSIFGSEPTVRQSKLAGLCPPSTAPRWAIHLPKAHLHIHLGGACPSWYWNHIMPDDSPTPIFQGDCLKDGFDGFEAHHHWVCDQIKKYTTPTRLLQAIALQAAAEGTRWMEIQVNPDRWADWVDIHDLARACHRSSHGTNVGIGLIVLAARNDPDRAMDLAKIAASMVGSGVVGFGVAGDQAARPLSEFQQAMQVAADAGLILAPHAGEIGPDTSELYAARTAGYKRIAHGIAAANDRQLMKMLAEDNICLDIAPSSNCSMGLATMDSHPIKTLTEHGVPCSINTDNPVLVGHDLAQEYAIVRDNTGYDVVQMARYADASFHTSGATHTTRQQAIVDIQKWIDRWSLYQ